MTRCARGEHEFPIEDESGAYCEEHGVALEWTRRWSTPSPTERDTHGQHGGPVDPGPAWSAQPSR